MPSPACSASRPRSPCRCARRRRTTSAAGRRRLHGAGLAPRSIALELSAWRGFYRWLGRDGLVAANPVDGVRAPRAAQPLPKALSVDHAVALVAHRDELSDPRLAARDACIAELLYGCGLRVGELVGLDVVAERQRGRLDRRRRRERARPGQGQEAPRRPGRRAGARGARRVARAARRHRARRRGGALRQQPRHAPDGEPGALAPEGARDRRRRADARPSAHAAPLVRLARAAVERRPARGAGAARPRQHHDDAGLHQARLRPPLEGVRRGASARAQARASRSAQAATGRRSRR